MPLINSRTSAKRGKTAGENAASRCSARHQLRTQRTASDTPRYTIQSHIKETFPCRILAEIMAVVHAVLFRFKPDITVEQAKEVTSHDFTDKTVSMLTTRLI